MKSPYTLPNLRNLVAFEAVGRTQSFTRAASELNVTKGALSVRIKALEDELSTKLVERRSNGAEVTEAGQEIFVVTQKFLHLITEQVERLSNTQDPSKLIIQSTIATSTLWLTPKISQFWQVNPAINIEQLVMDDPSVSPRADIFIGYGDPINSTESHSEILFHDQLIPVCSPEFAKNNPIDNLSTLAASPLIHMLSGPNNWTSWAQWFQFQGLVGPDEQGKNVNNHVVALNLARQGAGICLGWKAQIKELLDSRELVHITDASMPSPTPMVVTYRLSQKPAIGKFLQWIRQYQV